MRKRAFTLIELLVVISIIALLLSILLPGLQKAKQHALRLVCKTNLHQYGIAGTLYMAENKDRFPDPWQSLFWSCQGRSGHVRGACTDVGHQTFRGEPGRLCRWHNESYSLESHPEYAGPLWTYVQNEKVNLCPVFKTVSLKRGSEHPSHNAGIPIVPQFGYSQNAYLGGTNYPGYSTQFGCIARLGQVQSPARTFFFAEENMWVINKSTGYKENLSDAVLNDTALLARTQPAVSTNYADCFATFHSPPGNNYNEGTGNAAMLDGAVQSVQPQDNGTFKLAWPQKAMSLR